MFSNLFFTNIWVLHCREPVLLNPVLHSTFVLIKHRVIPMDLVLVQTPSQQFYSFLSVTWGIVADIDFESEKYRNLGEARFTLGAIKRIVSKCHCITNKKEKGGWAGHNKHVEYYRTNSIPVIIVCLFVAWERLNISQVCIVWLK